MSGKWICPVCGSNAYWKMEKVRLPAIRYYVDEEGKEQSEPTTLKGNRFACKGCSVLFTNPIQFNELNEKIQNHKAVKLELLNPVDLKMPKYCEGKCEKVYCKDGCPLCWYCKICGATACDNIHI